MIITCKNNQYGTPLSTDMIFPDAHIITITRLYLRSQSLWEIYTVVVHILYIHITAVVQIAIQIIDTILFA
jgi:hypothetical protein